jgi:hypothetical protein
VDASGHGWQQVEISGHSGQKWTQANKSGNNLIQLDANLIQIDAILHNSTYAVMRKFCAFFWGGGAKCFFVHLNFYFLCDFKPHAILGDSKHFSFKNKTKNRPPWGSPDLFLSPHFFWTLNPMQNLGEK